MTPAEIDDLEAKLRAATPGPWTDDGSHIRADCYKGRECKEDRDTLCGNTHPAIFTARAWPQDRWDFLGDEEMTANRQMVVTLRDKLPAIIDDLRALARLREATDSVLKRANQIRDDLNPAIKGHEAARFAELHGLIEYLAAAMEPQT